MPFSLLLLVFLGFGVGIGYWAGWKVAIAKFAPHYQTNSEIGRFQALQNYEALDTKTGKICLAGAKAVRPGLVLDDQYPICSELASH